MKCTPTIYIQKINLIRRILINLADKYRIFLINSQVKIATFPGYSTQDIKDHIKPLLRRNPDEIIVHVGTNSLRSSNECAVELIDLAPTVSSESSATITISSLIIRSDDEALA